MKFIAFTSEADAVKYKESLQTFYDTGINNIPLRPKTFVNAFESGGKWLVPVITDTWPNTEGEVIASLVPDDRQKANYNAVVKSKVNRLLKKGKINEAIKLNGGF